MKYFYGLIFSVVMAVATSQAMAANWVEIDTRSKQALENLYEHSFAARALAEKAAGVLVFPRVYKAGFGLGGEYGEGKLFVGGQTADYYSIAAGSFGFQIGAQMKSEVIMFMTQDALDIFRYQQGWKAGIDGSIAIATLGAGGSIDSETSKKPIIGFVFSNMGLMYNLTLEGSKITKIKRK